MRQFESASDWACGSPSTISAPATRRSRYLQRFPIDILKIDKCFIDDLHGDDQNASVVRAIIDIATGLHLDVIAEGIEYQQQADQLTRMHAPLGQGFLFSRPISPAAVLALMQPAHGSHIPPR